MEGMTLPLDTNRNAPNCGVVSTAIAAGVSYNEAFMAFIIVGGEWHKNWKGATTRLQRRDVLKHFGVKFTEIPVPEPMTLHRWMANHSWPSERYMVTTTGHVQMVHDGHVTDQKGLRPIDQYRWRSKRIKHIWRIDK